MGLLDALRDPEYWRMVRQGATDAVNRGAIGGLIGAPVDAAAGVVNAGLMGLGYAGHKAGLLSAGQMPQPILNPIGGSEWIGRKMQNRGYVSPNRNALAEMLAGMVAPSGTNALAKALYGAETVIAANAAAARPAPIGLMAQQGAINPDDPRRLGNALRKMGLNPSESGSGLSSSQYFQFENPKTLKPIKIRISDHDYPSHYGTQYANDFDLASGHSSTGVTRAMHTDDNWLDVAKKVSERTGVDLPKYAKNLVDKRQLAEDAANAARLQQEQLIKQSQIDAWNNRPKLDGYAIEKTDSAYRFKTSPTAVAGWVSRKDVPLEIKNQGPMAVLQWWISQNKTAP